MEMKEKPLRKAIGLACAALVASNDKARTHKKITKLWLKENKKKNYAFSGRRTAFPKALLLKTSALQDHTVPHKRVFLPWGRTD